MDKEKLIKLAEDLYQSAFDANAYYAIMMQYREMSKKYNDEMNLSRAVSYGNIDDMEGTLMLAKLGLKYQDYEMEQRHKQILKEIYADKKE